MGKGSGWKQTMEKVFDIIGEILAVIYVIVFALLLIDAQWPFISNVICANGQHKINKAVQFNET